MRHLISQVLAVAMLIGIAGSLAACVVYDEPYHHRYYYDHDRDWHRDHDDYWRR